MPGHCSVAEQRHLVDLRLGDVGVVLHWRRRGRWFVDKKCLKSNVDCAQQLHTAPMAIGSDLEVAMILEIHLIMRAGI